MSLEPGSEKPGAKKRAAKKTDLDAVFATLKKAIAGDLSTRVPTGELTGEVAELGGMINGLLERLSGDLARAELRNSVAAREIDRALGGLTSLVEDGDLTRWASQSEDTQLRMLL